MSILSIQDILNKLNIKTGVIRALCNEFNIETQSIKDIANNDKTKTKRENYCKEKYGMKNVLSKGTIIYDKRNDTVKERYGVENVFQLKSIKDKIKNTMINNWGVPCGIFLPQHKVSNSRSKPHIKVEEYLKSKKINFKSEVKNMFIKNNYSPIVDILIENNKTVIEIYGNYFHGNPLMYKEDDIIKKYSGNKFVKEIWEEDEKRINQIKEFNYDVIILWEKEIHENDFSKLNHLIDMGK
jgi:G:T-mismatch repair DNA endonuclease (very short patch repair protein)